MVAAATLVSAEEYERISLAEPDRKLELIDGQLREKPEMSVGHDLAQARLVFQLTRQLDPDHYAVHFSARLERPSGGYVIPDVCVVPTTLIEPIPSRRTMLNRYSAPMPLVVEVWSPSTGAIDVDDKLPAYQDRGDLEIWRLHPSERTLTTWRRRDDGSYRSTLLRGGMVSPIAFPAVTIEIEPLFS